MDPNARTDCAKEAHSNTPPLPFEEDLLSGRDPSSGDPPLSLEEAEAIWSIFLGVRRVAQAHSFAPGAALRPPSSHGRDDARHGGSLEEDSREAGRLRQEAPAALQHWPCWPPCDDGGGTHSGASQGGVAGNSWPVRRAFSPPQARLHSSGEDGWGRTCRIDGPAERAVAVATLGLNRTAAPEARGPVCDRSREDALSGCTAHRRPASTPETMSLLGSGLMSAGPSSPTGTLWYSVGTAFPTQGHSGVG